MYKECLFYEYNITPLLEWVNYICVMVKVYIAVKYTRFPVNVHICLLVWVHSTKIHNFIEGKSTLNLQLPCVFGKCCKTDLQKI